MNWAKLENFFSFLFQMKYICQNAVSTDIAIFIKFAA